MDKELIELYYKEKLELKILEHEVNTLNMAIKREMKKLNKTKKQIDEYLVRVQYQNKRVVKSEKQKEFIEYLKNRGFNNLVVEDYNKNLLRRYIDNETIDINDIRKYMDCGIVELLYITKK